MNIEFNIKTVSASIITVLTLIGGILAFDDRYATSADLKKTEVQLVQTLEQFKQSQVIDRLEQRYINLTDQVMQYKLMIKKNPIDKELKEDLNKLEQDRAEVKKKLEEKR